MKKERLERIGKYMENAKTEADALAAMTAITMALLVQMSTDEQFSAVMDTMEEAVQS